MEHYGILMKHELLMDTPVGQITIVSDGENLTELCFGNHRQNFDSCPVLVETARQLTEYFAGVRREFSLPLKPEGTAFQRSVWTALQSIPYGSTASYGEIAAKIGNPRACRAVGGANNRNPIAIIVPCHRVMGARGDLTGYAGGLERKIRLLELEKAG